jgi:hypothetical protein
MNIAHNNDIQEKLNIMANKVDLMFFSKKQAL